MRGFGLFHTGGDVAFPMTREAHPHWFRATWPFVLLCLLSASRWIAADQWPQTGSTLRSEAVACALAAGILLAFRSRAQPSPPPRHLLWAGSFGLALLAVPSLSAALTGPASEPFNHAVAMCFIPLVAAMVAGIRSGTGMTGLGAPLAGIAGALFLFPLALPVDISGWAGLALPPLVIGIVCGLWTKAIPTHPRLAAAFTAGGALGLCVIETTRTVMVRPTGTPFAAVAVALDLAAIACVVLTLQRLGTERYLTRYFWAPALTVVEGMLIFRPAFSIRIWTGLVLIVAAAILFWRPRSINSAAYISA